MVAAWHLSVDVNDVRLHLGDVTFGSRALVEKHLEMLAALPGRFYLIRGNHDSWPKLQLYERIGRQVVSPFALQYRGWAVAFSHTPAQALASRMLSVHGHIHAEPESSPFHINGSVERPGYRPAAMIPLLDARIDWLEAQGPPA
jgi:calcineurin-like phosphoesterase family protein